MALTKTIDEVLEDFAFLTDWEERYRYIIDLGRELPRMDDALKTESSKVQGCMSQVWMVVKTDGGTPPRYEFIAESDAQIVNGEIALLLIIYNGKTAEEIGRIDLRGIFTRLDLESHLSVNRRNGFFSMVEKIRSLAGVGGSRGATGA